MNKIRKGYDLCSLCQGSGYIKKEKPESEEKIEVGDVVELNYPLDEQLGWGIVEKILKFNEVAKGTIRCRWQNDNISTEEPKSLRIIHKRPKQD